MPTSFERPQNITPFINPSLLEESKENKVETQECRKKKTSTGKKMNQKWCKSLPYMKSVGQFRTSFRKTLKEAKYV